MAEAYWKRTHTHTHLPMIGVSDLADFAFADATMVSTFVAMMVAWQLYLAAFDAIAVAMIASKFHRQWPILYSSSSAHCISIYLDSENTAKQIEWKRIILSRKTCMISIIVNKLIMVILLFQKNPNRFEKSKIDF